MFALGSQATFRSVMKKKVDGKSILSLMMLAAVKGTTLTVQADGPDQQEALKAVADLVNERFGETE